MRRITAPDISSQSAAALVPLVPLLPLVPLVPADRGPVTNRLVLLQKYLILLLFIFKTIGIPLSRITYNKYFKLPREYQ
jgi:hypothetical protein